MRILLVEDDTVIIMILKKALIEKGHQVLCAEDGQIAWDLFTKEHFDLVITDWNMPEMNGLELCNNIRKAEKEHYTYIILITGKEGLYNKIEAFESGVDDIMTKPIELQELHARIVVAERIITIHNKLHRYQKNISTTNESLSKANQFMELTNKRFSELFDGIPIACLTTDIDGNIFEWNTACENLFKYKGHEVLGKKIDLLFQNERVQKIIYNSMKRTILSKLPETIEIKTHTKAKSCIIIELHILPIIGLNNDINGIIFSCLDVTKNKELEEKVKREMIRTLDYSVELELKKANLQKLNEKLESLATTDGLTGIANHRSFQQHLEKQFDIYTSTHKPVSVVLMDIDFFKQYNDTFGHPAGDVVLINMGKLLKSSARESDFPARYGGEEFVFILENTSKEESIQVAENIRKTIENESWPNREITVSVGVSTLNNMNNVKASELIDQADKALYKSKKEGRNRTQHFSDM